MSQRYRVAVCRGVTCTGLFADDVFRAFRKQVERKGLSALVTVERSGCLARCGGGASVIVREGAEPEDPFGLSPAGAEADGAAPPIVYPELMEPDVPRVVDEHLVRGVPVAPLLIARRGAKSGGGASGCGT